MNFKIFAIKIGGQFAPVLGGQFTRYLHFLYTYLIKENKFAQLIQTENTVLFAFDYKDKLYYII